MILKPVSLYMYSVLKFYFILLQCAVFGTHLRALGTGFVVRLKSKTDSCSITGTGTAAGSAGIGGAKLEAAEDLLNEAKSNGDLDETNNCSFDTGSFEPGSSKIGLPVVDV